MSAPAAVDYGARAGVNPRPADHVDDWMTAHTSLDDAVAFAAATGWIFWADVSEFQPLVDSSYPYHQLCVRLDTGWRLDNNAMANHRRVAGIDHIQALMGYVVFIPGQSKNILSRLRGAFGATPDFAVMTDMESGSGFAGPGDHSAEANDFQDEIAAWTGSRARELGYANKYDWASNWPHRPSWLKRMTASYGSVDPGTWGWQYYGGLKYATVTGFPRACKPFGSWVDMNAAKMTTTRLLDDTGLDWLSMATEDQVKAAVQGVFDAELKPVLNRLAGANERLVDILNGDVAHPLAGLRDIAPALQSVADDVNSIKKKVGA